MVHFNRGALRKIATLKKQFETIAFRRFGGGVEPASDEVRRQRLIGWFGAPSEVIARVWFLSSGSMKPLDPLMFLLAMATPSSDKGSKVLLMSSSWRLDWLGSVSAAESFNEAANWRLISDNLTLLLFFIPHKWMMMPPPLTNKGTIV